MKTPPMDDLHERDEVPLVVVVLRVMLFGLSVQVRPVAGETIVLRSTFPLKRLIPVAVIVETPVPPLEILTVAGLAETV